MRNLDTDTTTSLRDFTARDDLRPLLQAQKATSVARALAAFSILLFRYTGEESQLVRLTRVDPDGQAVSSTAVSLSIHGTMTILAALEQAVTCLTVNEDAFDCRSIVLGEHLTLDAAPKAGPPSRGGQAAEPPRLFVTVRGGDSTLLSGMSLVHGVLAAPAPARSVSAHWRRVMDALVEDLEVSIQKIPLLDEEDFDVLERWSRSEDVPELIDDALLHELFEWETQRHPDRVAVDCAGVTMTYRELNARANQLARHLRARGVGVGAFVAFQLPRSGDVYVAILGVLKTGAAYVPLDPSYPRERVLHVLEDASARVLLTTSAQRDALGVLPWPTFCFDSEWGAVAAEATDDLARAEVGATATDVCYVIFTSGSTGRPKGVAVEHKSACHLVRAEAHLFHPRSTDRVYQGFSIAFDAAVEEVWLALFAGATLVVGTQEMVSSGADLAAQLTAAGVTVLSCVPTLLSMFTEDLPTVRLLILGGEGCPQDLANRWSTGRRMVNTYGPTEATVIATYCDLQPNVPVTIGRPIPNTWVFLLDSSGSLVPPGVPGELYIGGVALARGYVGQPQLTRAKFVPNLHAEVPTRLYRTGDLARFNAAGELEFLGRADEQVKIRGFRVELSEIESLLLGSPGVSGAVVAVREDTPGIPTLVGYVTAAPGAFVREDTLKAHLRSALPPYMVPARIHLLDEMPTLPSGKVNRKALLARKSEAASEADEARAPATRTDIEQRISAAWASALGASRVGPSDDFFLDLGGHSLAASHAISALRRERAFEGLSVLDLYRHPTVLRLAAHVQQTLAPESEAVPSEAEVTSTNDARDIRHGACGVMQAASLYALYGVYALEWTSPYVVYAWLLRLSAGFFAAIGGGFAIAIVVPVALLLLGVATKWAVIGRYREGHYPLWGTYYFRHWLVETTLSMAPIHFLAGTPLLNLYLRALGARIGAGAYLGTTGFSAFDLLAIGDGSSIDADASLLGAHVFAGELVVGPVEVGARAYVGHRSVLVAGSAVGEGASVDALSMLPAGARIPAGEQWTGSPARPASPPAASAPPPRAVPEGAGLFLLYGVLVAALPLVLLSWFLPSFVVIGYLGRHTGGSWYLFAAPVVSVGFVLLACTSVTAFKWALLGKVKPGSYPIHGSFYVRHWVFDRLMGMSLTLLGGLFGTLYLAPWYRTLGVKLGKGAEVSTAQALAPDLLEIDEDAFVADAVSIGAPEARGGFLTLAQTRVGKRAFVGNSGVVPLGASVADDALIGCLSRPPESEREQAARGASWFGSPAVALPHRQKSEAFDRDLTFSPSASLFASRLAIELVRVTLPSTCFIVLTSLFIAALFVLAKALPLALFVLAIPGVYIALGLAAALFVVLLKWVLVGRYRASEHPLWSSFVWRSELVTGMQENVADTFFNDPLKGTPFLAWFFRTLGAKIGSRVYLGMTEFTEYDLVTIGDDACLNPECTIQTHLFEDRVMKMSTVRVGARCSVGVDAVVLYDTQMENGSTLAALSLLMKGETLPARSHWEGAPAGRVARRG